MLSRAAPRNYKLRTISSMENFSYSKESVANRQLQAGPKVAAIFSVVESCRRLQVPVRDHFSTILPRFADLPIRYLPDLTPAVWVTRHS